MVNLQREALTREDWVWLSVFAAFGLFLVALHIAKLFLDARVKYWERELERARLESRRATLESRRSNKQLEFWDLRIAQLEAMRERGDWTVADMDQLAAMKRDGWKVRSDES